MSTIYYATALSDVAGLLGNYGAENNEQAAKVSAALEVLRYTKVPEELQMNVLDFYYKTKHSKELQDHFEEFMSILSPSK